MRFVNKQAVNTEFLKGHNIVLTGLVVKLFKLLLDRLFCLLKLLNREILTAISFEFRNAVHYFFKLLIKNSLLTLNRHRYFFKLTVADNDGIIIARSNTTAEFLAVFSLKILFTCDQNVRRRVELQILRRPLLRQMIRDYKQGLIAETEPLGFLCRRNHFKGFSCPDNMRKQGVSAVKNVSNGIDLMRSERNFRVHTYKDQVLAVIFSRTDAVEFFVIELAQPVAALLILPYPVGKGILYKLLLTLCDSGIVLIEYGLFIAVFVLNIIEHTHITQVQRFLDDLIPVDSVCAVSVINLDIVAVVGLALNIPFTRILAVMHVNIKRYIPRGPEKLKHKPFNILGRYPSSPQAHRYLTCGKVFRHNLG